MSLILNDYCNESLNMAGDGPLDDHRDLANIDRYLAIIENNQKASRFVPNDALLALDMAGFVAGQLFGGGKRPGISAARLALSLVQPCATVQ